VQDIRQEFPHQIEAGRGSERDPCVVADVSDSLIAGGSPNAGNRACTYNACDAGNGKGRPALRIPRREGAEDRVARARPETLLVGRIISIVFVEKEGGAVGEGLADAVVRQIASKALSIRPPTLSPLLGAVLPLADAGAGGLGQDWDRPGGGDKI